MTYWVRHYFLNKETRFILASEINDEGAKLLRYYKNIALNLNLYKMNIRIRLFGLQNGLVNCDQFLQRNLHSYRAPDSNDIEIMLEVSIDSANKEFAELLMRVWEQFRTPNGEFARFNDKEFLKSFQ